MTNAVTKAAAPCCPRLRRSWPLLGLALGLVAALPVSDNYLFARQLEAVTRGRDAETYLVEEFYPGMLGAVRVLRESGSQPVYIVRRDQNLRVHQRLLEMLYPVRPVPYRPELLASGDLVALDTGRRIEVPADAVYRSGLVAVWRVR